jgi:hypothetical protein
MSDRMVAYLWRALAVLLYIVSAATGFAVLYALTVRTTLAAVESAFGTFVILILLLVFARKCWEKGSKGQGSGDAQGGSGAGKSL